MKPRSLAPVVLVIMLVFVAFAPLARADVDAGLCQICKVGVDPAGNYISLKNIVAAPKWIGCRPFYLSPTLGSQGLAAVLTALSMGRDVWVRVGGDGSAYSLVKIVYISE